MASTTTARTSKKAGTPAARTGTSKKKATPEGDGNVDVATSEGPSHDAIAALAYQLFLESGGAHGRDIEHWLAAEAKLARKPS